MSIRRFQDFVLVADDVRRKDGNGFVEGFTVHVFDSPVGQGEKKEQVTLPDFSQHLRFLEDRTYDNKVEKQIELGQTLADLLLPPYARTLFRQSLSRIRDDEGLRLRLRLDDALADFPWEYMYIQGTRGERVSSSFLALDPQISIVRHEAMALPADGLDVPGDFHETPAQRRVVVAMAAPPGYPPLSGLLSEQKAIREALGTLPGIEATYVPEYKADHYDQIPSATVEDVFSAIRLRADIFHFSGHGEFAVQMGPVLGSKVGEGGIVLASTAGKALPVAADRFAEILRGKGVRLVVLGACHTARRDGRNVWSGVAPALLRVGIPAVVAMQFKILDEVAAPFIGTMYQALVEGREIDEAVGLGRAAIRRKAGETTRQDLRDWGVPVLYLRSAHGVVFRPVSDESAVKKAAASLAAVIEHQKQEPSIQVRQSHGKIGPTGRVLGAELASVTSGSVFVDQKVKESVDGVMIGAKAHRVEGGKVEVFQAVETVTGELKGVAIENLGGVSSPAGDVTGCVPAVRPGATAAQPQASIQEIESSLKLGSLASPAAVSTQCPRCQEKIPPGAKFCPHCGQPQPKFCKSCGQGLPAGARFCSQCGNAAG